MLRPKIGARIKKPYENTGSSDNRAHVAAFRPIAKHAGVRQVVSFGLPAMFFADDVIDFTAEVGIVLMNQAIFTEVFCPCRHELAQGRANVRGH